jgi:two-component system cell cycle response regulator
MLDIDRFKNINDTYGHTAGDDALRQTAFYLNHVFSPEHLVSRFGGDEFLIFMQHVDKNMVMSSLDKLMTLMSIGGNIYDKKITCSMGVVYSDSVHAGTDPEKLLKKADEALYRAKAQGRNRYLFSDESIKDKTAKR